MKEKFFKLMILFMMLSFLTVSALAVDPPAMEWHQAYNGSGEESHPHYVIETSDGGFLMVGETGFIPNSAKIYVVKTNSSGGLLWQKEFGSSGYNLGNGCVETPDGNYVIAGTLNYDAVLIKVDASTGNALSGWPKTWNLGTEDSFEAVENTQDGGLIATGYRDGLAESTFLNWGKGNLIKTDANGNQIWNKDISAYMCSGYRMKRISDGYMVSGHPAEEGQPDYTLMKFDFDGNIVWYKTPHPDIYWGFDVGANGHMILTGHGASPLSSNLDIVTVEVDSAGNPLWTEYAGQPRGYNGDYIHDEVWGARATPDGGWILTAGSGDEYSYSECGHPLGCSDQWIVYCLKYSSSGTLEWEGLYGGEGDWAGEDICLTSDGGALVANDCGAFGFTKIEPFGAPDTDPPTPDPMTWASVPSADGENSISMTATTASDPSGVEYYFDETSGNPGGSDSGWQSSPSYTDTGLNASTQYCYQVKARDLSVNNNETAYSSTQCATTTSPDTTPPTPDPMNFSVMPYSTGPSSIAMSAVTASDPSGVEYYFDETSGNPGGSDSGWQDSTSYEDAGLDPDTQYTYQVKARDKSAAQNETGYSSSQSATTDPAPQWTVIISDDFEAGFGNWNDGGTDCSLYTDGTYAHQGSNAVLIVDNSTPPASTTYTNNLALAAYDEVKVDFWYYPRSMDNAAEDFWLQISTNGGADWTTVEEWNKGDEFENGSFYPDSVIITGYTLTDQTQLRFRCHASGNQDFIYLDEVVVSAGGGTPPDTDPPTPDPATWSSVPSADSDTAISMTAATGSDASPPVEYSFEETSGNPGGSDSGWQTSASYTDTGLTGSTQYTYRVQMRDSLGNTGGYSTSESATTDPTVDTDPPTPDPAEWSSVPSADSDTAISMTATTGSDASGPVEYSFEETSGNPGGSDSGWQSSASYTDSGLNASTQYTYRVRMRDSLSNTGGYSTSESATTQAEPDTTPPTPDPMTWQSLPSADSGVAISMQATTASDPSGVEYYFNNVTDPAHDSGWQGSSSYTDSGLTPDTQYTYQVKARDQSPAQNETAYSTAESATTLPAPGLMAEFGVVSSVGNSWQTVTLTNTYDSMVVVTTANYDNTSGPVVVRIQNASGSSFDVRVDPAGGATPSGIDVHYLVVEEGVYTVAQDGVTMEAVKYNSTVTDENNSWVGEPRTYSNTYTSPVVLGQVMSYSDPDFSTFWCFGSARANPPDTSNLNTGKSVAEDTDTTRNNETVGYIVIEAGSGNINGDNYVAALGADSVLGVTNAPPYTYSISGLSGASVAIASLSAMDGGNGGWALLYGANPVSASAINLAIDEDQVGDTERSHTAEQVAYIVFEDTGAPDTDPPTPDPATFASAPAAVSDTAISMTATTGSDPSGPVEYFFDETSGNPGGSDSGWQTSATYTDTGLSPSTQYTYTVTMRDALANTGTASAPANATTNAAPDTDPPTPNPATFASPPSADSSSAISMTAATGSDPSGPVEYFFDETSGNPGGSDSGWQTSPSYTDTGLSPDTQYTYTVQMRDSVPNTGTASSPASATTDPVSGSWIKVDDRDGSVTYTGSTWHQTNPSTAYMNTATFTQDMGISATYSFTGTQVRFYVWQYDTSQGYDVYIDEQFQQTVNISAGSEASILAWESGTLADTSHNLRIETASGEPHVDAFEHFGN